MTCKATRHLILSIGHDKDHTGARSVGHPFITEWGVNQHLVAKVAQVLNRHYKGQVKIHIINELLTETVNVVNDICAIAGAENCIAVEFHFNSAVNKSAVGIETLYFPFSKYSKQLAKVFNAYVFEANPTLYQKNRGAKAGWYQGLKNGKLLYFLKATKCPALIAEPMFINQLRHIEPGADFDMADDLAGGLIKINEFRLNKK